MRLAIQTRLFYSHLLAVLLVSGSIGGYFYLSAVDNLLDSVKARLRNSAALISRSLSARDLEAVRRPEDSGRPEYRQALHTLRDYAASNSDIAFVYIMRQEGGQVWFVIDSDTSAEQALPGTLYPNPTPALRQGFVAPAVDQAITYDAWGAFLSGFAPLKDGEGRYLIGLDMRADVVARQLRNLRITGVVCLGLSILLALLFSRLLAAHFQRPLSLLIARCREIAEGKLGGQVTLHTRDELDQMILAINNMSLRLEQSSVHLERTRQALQASRDQLELRVIQRTQALERLNRQLMQEVQERQRAQEALQQAARTDPLTGLLNRRAMLELLGHEARQTRRQQQPFGIVLADIDHFKQVNDRHGHYAGDQVLIQVAETLRHGLRAQDAVARWGGEEFLLLLPNTPLAGACQAAEKIRSRVETLASRFRDADIRVTLSLGVSEFTGAGILDDAIKQADMAMYRAKHAGRNRVAAAGDAAATPAAATDIALQ